MSLRAKGQKEASGGMGAGVGPSGGRGVALGQRYEGAGAEGERTIASRKTRMHAVGSGVEQGMSMPCVARPLSHAALRSIIIVLTTIIVVLLLLLLLLLQLVRWVSIRPFFLPSELAFTVEAYGLRQSTDMFPPLCEDGLRNVHRPCSVEKPHVNPFSALLLLLLHSSATFVRSS